MRLEVEVLGERALALALVLGGQSPLPFGRRLVRDALVCLQVLLRPVVLAKFGHLRTLDSGLLACGRLERAHFLLYISSLVGLWNSVDFQRLVCCGFKLANGIDYSK